MKFDPKDSAMAKWMARCHLCVKVSPVSDRYCVRCGSKLHLRNHQSLQRTTALLTVAIMFYLPANIFPIMTTELLGREESNTILSGIILFVEHGDFLIAAIIFLASVMIPLLKILILAWLCYIVKAKVRYTPKKMQRLYAFTELVGRWSMIDVFVVAVLVGIIQLGKIMTILPGTAIIAFTLVVVFTMLAATSFDSRLLWDHANKVQAI